MLTRFPLGAWVPDLAPTSGMLAEAKNVIAGANGYIPCGSFTAIAPDIEEPFRGGGAFVSSTGTAALIAATPTKLRRYSGSGWADLLTGLTAGRWQFTQFGDLVICTFGGEPQKFDLVGGTAATLGGSPPDSSMCATVRDFVWLAGNPLDLITLTISGFNDAEGWTPGVNQSTDQTFPDGGEIMGLIGGEYGLILQKGAVRRGTYVGGEVIWQFDVIESEVGAMAKGSIATVGRRAYFLSERGFMFCDGNTVTPIGAEKVDKTFFKTYPREQIEQITSAIDPQSHTVMWAMPGVPGKMWAYNWLLDRWTTIELGIQGLFGGFTANISIDALDGIYPGGIDTIPYSLDDVRFAGGSPLLLVANDLGEIGALTGASMAAKFELQRLEPIQGRTIRCRAAWPISDAGAATVTLDVRRKASDTESLRMGNDMRGNGSVPLRATGRFIDAIYEIPAETLWSYASALDLEYEAGGTR